MYYLAETNSQDLEKNRVIIPKQRTFKKLERLRVCASLCATVYEGDPRSNANTSVISFKFAIIKKG